MIRSRAVKRIVLEARRWVSECCPEGEIDRRDVVNVALLLAGDDETSLARLWRIIDRIEAAGRLRVSV